MRTLPALVCGLAASLVLAVPAWAQAPAGGVPDEAPVCSGVGEETTTCSTAGADEQTVVSEEGPIGPGEVITDPADEIDGPPKRGELHVLGESRGSAVASSQPATSSAPAPAAAPAAASTPAAETAPVSEATAARRPADPNQLPFTGVNGGYIALCGAALLAAGLGLRRMSVV